MAAKTTYFRNRFEIKDCEPESLWKLTGIMLILVDDDQYVSANPKNYPDLFYKVTDPFPKNQPIS